MKRYLLSFLCFIPLYFFWCGIIPVLFELKPPAGAIAFVSGLFFVYPIANRAERKGYSWWKHFLIFGFLSTGIPIIGIIKLIQINKVKNNILINGNIKTSECVNKISKNITDEKTEMEIWLENYYNGTSIQKEKYLNDIKSNPIKWVGNVEDVNKSSINIKDNVLEGIFVKTVFKEYKIIFLIKETDDIYCIRKGQNYEDKNYGEIYELDKLCILINNLSNDNNTIYNDINVIAYTNNTNKLEDILDNYEIYNAKKIRRIYNKNVYIDHLRNILKEKNIAENIIEEIIKYEYDNC
jgi:hypothetical protein